MSEQKILEMPLADLDPEVAEAIELERKRQQNTLEMIASENFVPRAVLESQGSVLTNKYAEGYPGRRYYGGCEFVDIVESLAISRVKELFGAEHANVQPHSGAQANNAVMHALLNPGDTIMGLSLAHGGHLTHGMKLNVSGKLYHVVAYGVDESGRVDMEQVRELALAERPKLIIAGWSAYPRQLDSLRSARLLTRSARTCGWTWLTSRAWWLRVCTRTPSRTHTWSPPPCTRPWAAPAPASSSAPRS